MEDAQKDFSEEIREKLRGRKVVISMFCGEIGWFLQYYQGFMRFLKQNDYKDYDFVIICNRHLHAFVDDFIFFTVSFPDWFKNLGLDQDCYEAVIPNSPPASLTPPEVYQNLVVFMADLCKYTEEYELLLPPRGCNLIMNTMPQVFCKFYTNEKVQSDKPIITVFPRTRVRASNRNVPEFVWYDLVMKLREFFTIVLAGTPSGACLADLEDKDIINLIKYDEDDKTEKIITYLNNSTCSISSQSGGTHISLLSGTPSYIIGHERERHATQLNRLNIPTSFRVVADYRAIDADTIINDVREFIQALAKEKWFSKINRPSLRLLEGKKNLVGVEIGVDAGLNALNILENLDIEKLYLVDPYYIYDNLVNVGCNFTDEQCKKIEKEAHERLEKYNDKIVWLKDLSENAIKSIPDNLDFCYIDGNHRKEFVQKDIDLYYPKVKEGGLISFHDYDYDGVRQAVNERFPNPKYDSCADNLEREEAWIIKPTTYENILFQDYNKLVELCK